MSARNALIAAIAEAAEIPSDLADKLLTSPKETGRGDFALPCFPLAKDWKLSPPECAKKLSDSLQLPAQIQRFEIAGPYINFFLNRGSYGVEIVSDILREGKAFGSDNQKETIIVEYSSPNIAKPFHVGHLRTTLIGHALDRMYRHLGYNVVSINHLGDWGTQFGFVYAGCELWGRPEDASIDDLVELYKRASILRKAQDEGSVPAEDVDKPVVNEMAREYFRRLEANEEAATEFWQWCLDISVTYLQKMYTRLGIHFDYYTGESFYREMLPAVEDTLKNSGILEDSRGALGVELGKKLGFVRVFAEDGRSLYITRDIAAADYRQKEFDPAKIVYVVGAPQTLHFKQLVAILERMEHPAASLIQHVPYGHVPGISTRSGSSGDETSLRALLEEAHDRALAAYKTQVSKRPQDVDEELVAESVGLGAIFFNYLSRSNIKDFHFSWDEALTFQGDTGPYVQYAIARLNSISEKAAVAGLQPASELHPESLAEPEAYELVARLAKFPAILKKATADHEPYHIALYTLELAKAFSSGYRALRVIGEDTKQVAETRLALFAAVKNALEIGAQLIGVPPLEKM